MSLPPMQLKQTKPKKKKLLHKTQESETQKRGQMDARTCTMTHVNRSELAIYSEHPNGGKSNLEREKTQKIETLEEKREGQGMC